MRGALLVGLLAICGLTRAEEAAPPIGAPAPDIEFKDIRAVPRSLDELGARQAYVLIFVNETCPIVQASWPEFERLARDYQPRGVAVAALHVGLDATVRDVAALALEHGITFPIVKDSGAACARALGVRKTPEAVVLDAEKKIRYRGRVDGRRRLGGTAPSTEVRPDLRAALDEVLAGKSVSVPETPVDGCAITFPPETPAGPSPFTFTEHIRPILRKHCQECHRPGGDAPLALLTDREVAANAAMIAEVIEDGRMPPWYAGSKHGTFANARTLDDESRHRILDWARRGTPRGPDNVPPVPPLPTLGQWKIGEPDQVISMLGRHSIPDEGYVDYRVVVLPHLFTQDTWVQSVEILPDNPRVVHHCNMAFATLGEGYRAGNFITGRVPGGDPMVLDPGTALLLPKGSFLALQIHYTTTGRPERARISVGLKFPREPVNKRIYHSMVSTNRFRIPPGDPAHPVGARRTLGFDATGIGLFSHMHLRGKDMTFNAIDPDGSRRTLLTIPNYNFDWQQSYRFPNGALKFRKGTVFDVVAHYDNSAFNPFNPDPKASVGEGDQTFEEMMFGFYFYTRDDETLDLRIDPRTGRVVPQPDRLSTAK